MYCLTKRVILIFVWGKPCHFPCNFDEKIQWWKYRNFTTLLIIIWRNCWGSQICFCQSLRIFLKPNQFFFFSIQYFIRFKFCYFRHLCSLILEARFGGTEAPGANQGNENCCPEQVRLHGARLVVRVIFIFPSPRILRDGIPNGYWINVAVLCNIDVAHQCWL